MSAALFPDSKTLPHSLAAERAVLGILMLHTARDVWHPHQIAEIIGIDDFYREDHARLFALIIEMYEDNKPISMFNVVEQAVATPDKGAQFGGLSYISDLSNEVPSTEDVAHYAQQIAEYGKTRRLLAVLRSSEEAILLRRASTPEIITEIENFISSPDLSTDRGAEIVGDVLIGVFKETILEAGGDRDLYFSTGIKGMDGSPGFAGLSREGITLVIAASGIGKTSFANSIAIGLASGGLRVMMYPTETSKARRARDLMFTLANVDMLAWAQRAKLRSDQKKAGLQLSYNNWVGENFSRLEKAAVALAELPIFVCQTGWTIERLCAAVRRAHRRGEVDALVVDYLQDFTMSRAVGPSRMEQASHVSKMLKDLSTALSIPVVLTAQAKNWSRPPNEKDSQEYLVPQMGDVQWCSGAYQDAEEVYSLYRQDYYADRYDEIHEVNPFPGQRGMMTVAIRKRRTGGPMMLSVPFHGPSKWVGEREPFGGNR